YKAHIPADLVGRLVVSMEVEDRAVTGDLYASVLWISAGSRPLLHERISLGEVFWSQGGQRGRLALHDGQIGASSFRCAPLSSTGDLAGSADLRHSDMCHWQGIYTGTNWQLGSTISACIGTLSGSGWRGEA